MSGRNKKLTVDYFPHKIGTGKKMFMIDRKYQNNGYATWYKTLEVLAQTENHFIDLSNDENLIYLSAYCCVSEELLKIILSDISRLGKIDKPLWDAGVIWSEEFLDSVIRVYDKRAQKPMTKEEIYTLFNIGVKKEVKPPKKQKKQPKINNEKAFNFRDRCISEGCESDYVDEWLKIRAKRKANNSILAFNLFKKQVEQAGWTFQQAIEKCVARNWQSFEAKWVEKDTPKQSNIRKTHNNSGDGTDWEEAAAKG